LLLRLKANLHLQGPYKDVDFALKCVLECIGKNRADFDVEKISEYFLAPDEFILINMLAVAYKELEGLPSALGIWRKLKANYLNNYTVNIQTFNNPAYRDLTANIALALLHTRQYAECLDVARENAAMALQQHDMKAYSRCLHQQAFCLMKLGRTDGGKEWYKKFLMFAYVMDGYAAINFETVKKEYTDNFGEPLELSVGW